MISSIRDIGNASLYRETREKNVSIRVSMPRIGTVIRVYNNVIRTTYNKSFILDFSGYKFAISINELIDRYTLPDGTEITPWNLDRRILNGEIPPFKIIGKPNKVYWALQIPNYISNTISTENFSGYLNGPGNHHDSGDYIVCPDLQGRPDIKNSWIVVGEQFREIYDMRYSVDFRDNKNISLKDNKNIRLKDNIKNSRKTINEFAENYKLNLNPIDNTADKIQKSNINKDREVKLIAVVVRDDISKDRNTIVGRIVREIDTGRIRKIDSNEFYRLVQAGLIEGIYADRMVDDNGRENIVLYGNAVKNIRRISKQEAEKFIQSLG